MPWARNDQRTKGLLSKALGKDGILTGTELKEVVRPETFKKLAGPDGQLDATEIREAVETTIPPSRERLLPKVRAHADLLTTSLDLLDEPHVRRGKRSPGGSR